MKGIVNGVFVSDENEEEVKKVEDGIELTDRFSKSKTTECSNAKSNDDVDDHELITKWILKFRSSLYKWFCSESSTGKLIWYGFVNAISIAILIASIVNYISIGSPPIQWCTGVGFLWIVYIFAYFGLFFSAAKKWVEKPIENACNRISDRFASLTANKYVRGACYILPVFLIGVYVLVFPGKSGRRIFSFLGLIVFTIIGFLFSKHPGHIKWRTVISGLVIQFLFGMFAMNEFWGKNILQCIGNKVTTFLLYSESGAYFVYGPLSEPQKDTGLIFAFSVLPVIFFLSFFINILSYYGILQWFVFKLGWIVKVIMGTTVCESVNAAASIFLGMTEAPLLIKSCLKDLTKSELCAIMCAGWSTVAGVVMAAYIKLGVNASHLIAASFMSAPASLSYSKLIYPETEVSKNRVDNLVLEREKAENVLDAATKGAISAMSVVLSIVANIIAIISFISFVDGSLIWMGKLIGVEDFSVQFIMSKIFIPISFLMGTDMDSLEEVAYLVGIKTVANEFQAYQKLEEYVQQNKLSERSQILATYALCGFSNFGSIGITIGALSGFEPSQRSAITEVAFTAFFASNIVCFLTACVAGCLIQ